MVPPGLSGGWLLTLAAGVPSVASLETVRRLASLEKAVKRCQVRYGRSRCPVLPNLRLQDFIQKVHDRGAGSISRTNSLQSDKALPTLEVLTTLNNTFEAKKK